MDFKLWLVSTSIVLFAMHYSPSYCYKYMNNDELQNELENLASRFPSLTNLYHIGHSVQGRPLTVLQISGPDTPIGAPHVKLIGNIHGNQPVGREILYLFAKELLNDYMEDKHVAQNLLNTTFIHILPSMNPDGFELAQIGACLNGPGRRNADSVDLNRNFPSALYPNKVTTKVQPETQAVMEWMHQRTFVLSAAIYGGAVVVIYPYDAPTIEKIKAKEHKTEDDELYRNIALNYSETHRHMATMNECPFEHKVFRKGVVNGAAWYPAYGTMQDYNYDFHNCLEFTLLLSCCKYPGGDEIPSFYAENKNALINFVKQSHLGVKGVIRNGSEPIGKAAVSIHGRKAIHLTTDLGEYWILLQQGTYFLQVEKDGFQTETRLIHVPLLPQHNPVILNIDLGQSKEQVTLPEIDLLHFDDSLYPDTWAIVDYDEAWKAKVEETKQHGYQEENEVFEVISSKSTRTMTASFLLVLAIMFFV